MAYFFAFLQPVNLFPEYINDFSSLGFQYDTGLTMVLITDENCFKYCFPLLKISADKVKILTIPAGENQKNLRNVEKIWTFLSDLNIDRNTPVWVMGGGVLSDLAAFALSTFKRGIPYNLLPTTLLSMVDASSGGKTGINFHTFKNQVGTFSLPQRVIINPAFLFTLSEDEIRTGFAEMLKHGLILDIQHYKDALHFLEVKKFPDLFLIRKSNELKASVVLVDPKEKGWRKVLNFGHTFGHAIESLAYEEGKTVLHGDAVAAGMMIELILSSKYFTAHTDFYHEVFDKLKNNFPAQSWIELFKSRLIEKLKQDKKNSGGKILFSLLERPGKACINFPVSEVEAGEALEEYLIKISS